MRLGRLREQRIGEPPRTPGEWPRRETGRTDGEVGLEPQDAGAV